MRLAVFVVDDPLEETICARSLGMILDRELTRSANLDMSIRDCWVLCRITTISFRDRKITVLNAELVTYDFVVWPLPPLEVHTQNQMRLGDHSVLTSDVFVSSKRRRHETKFAEFPLLTGRERPHLYTPHLSIATAR
ncbi:hypothetical protein J6590_102027 [Homalodisca vitripennis]|nr:hypothetical protein J6590_055345 [Homalodisca vitripennis]KAG8284483.1 hypothetical protein J6590_102027 [Homalodisca vitripennis]